MHATEVRTFRIAEGVVSFMNKRNHLRAIKYGERYYPFEPRKCIGGEETFDALREGDHIYFPLIQGYVDHIILLTHMSPQKTEVLRIRSLDVAEEINDMTFGLLIPGLG